MSSRWGKRRIVERLTGKHLAAVLHACHWAKRMSRYANPKTRPRDLCLIDRFVRPGDVCLDIGANAGLWTYPMAGIVGSTGHIHAFEVFAYHAQALRRALWLRGVMR